MILRAGNGSEIAAAMSNRRPYHHGDLRAQLLETVRALIEEKGPDGFSISEASRRAGVSSAAPYKHFRDKPEIMKAVAIAGMERLADRMEAAAQAKPEASLERLSAIGKAYIDFARAEPGIFRVMFGATIHDEDPDVQRAGRRSYGILLDAVGARLGREPTDPDVLMRAYSLWTLVHGHSFLVIDDNMPSEGARPDEDAFLDQVGRQVMDG
ncbi:division inhibitor protein [Roseivivax jejudonensis]|uniref:Division inhibitor protein n=1 Tax=Roseivivax jejudonensis TaxID=1529041 RepID=A0A1X7A6K7_9RHOB|nr:TetR/AcrR family transcriptional regulator [Roseivivax jejudonensis]SLN71820.1 division inhibitor protein [Roseivivax jejudonensis]